MARFFSVNFHMIMLDVFGCHVVQANRIRDSAMFTCKQIFFFFSSIHHIMLVIKFHLSLHHHFYESHQIVFVLCLRSLRWYSKIISNVTCHKPIFQAQTSSQAMPNRQAGNKNRFIFINEWNYHRAFFSSVAVAAALTTRIAFFLSICSRNLSKEYQDACTSDCLLLWLGVWVCVWSVWIFTIARFSLVRES